MLYQSTTLSTAIVKGFADTTMGNTGEIRLNLDGVKTKFQYNNGWWNMSNPGVVLMIEYIK